MRKRVQNYKYKIMHENETLFGVREQIKTNQIFSFSVLFRLFTGNAYIEMLHDCIHDFSSSAGPSQIPATPSSHRAVQGSGLQDCLTLTMRKICLTVFVPFLFTGANLCNSLKSREDSSKYDCSFS